MILAKIIRKYEEVKEILGVVHEDEGLAFMLGYLDGEQGNKPASTGSWYKQGYKHGKLGDTIPGVRPDE